MTIVVPILSHPLSRPPSRLPHLPRDPYAAPCARGILAPTHYRHSP